MGLLQRAIETYDASAALAGVYREGHEPLAPISHITANAHIEIRLNEQGEFRGARLLTKKEGRTVIPVTEDSGGAQINWRRIHFATKSSMLPLTMKKRMNYI